MNSQFENRRWPYVIAWPFMQIIVLFVFIKKKIFAACGLELKINSLFYDGLGETCKKLKDTHGSAHSMHEIYNFKFGKAKGVGGLIGDFHQGCLNCQAVRNRFRIDRQEIGLIMDEMPKSAETEIRILSLACGTGQALIEAMSERRDRRVKALFVDHDAVSLEIARNIARQHLLEDRIEFVDGNAFEVESLCQNFKPHIVEVVGLMEYLLDEEAIELVKRIRNVLVPRGFLITSNIRKNLETRFVTWVIDWPMVYREPIQLENVLYSGGFVDVSMNHEPLGIHALATAR